MEDIQIIIIIILAIIAVFIGILIHFLPTIIAFKREASSRWIIFLVNLLLGWTFIIWLVALIWACEGRTDKKIVYTQEGEK